MPSSSLCTIATTKPVRVRELILTGVQINDPSLLGEHLRCTRVLLKANKDTSRHPSNIEVTHISGMNGLHLRDLVLTPEIRLELSLRNEQERLGEFIFDQPARFKPVYFISDQSESKELAPECHLDLEIL